MGHVAMAVGNFTCRKCGLGFMDRTEVHLTYVAEVAMDENTEEIELLVPYGHETVIVTHIECPVDAKAQEIRMKLGKDDELQSQLQHILMDAAQQAWEAAIERMDELGITHPEWESEGDSRNVALTMMINSLK